MTSRNKLTTLDHHHHHPHNETEEDEEILEISSANIFDASYCGEPVPAGFDAVRISLSGGMKAELSWKNEREAALAYVKQGLRLFWDIDLGLSGTLEVSLSNSTQFLTLSLSLEHFCSTLWKEFRQETIGLNLYRGQLDFSRGYRWDEEQTLNLQEWLKQLFQTPNSFSEETGIHPMEFSCVTHEALMQSETGKDLLKLFCRDAMGEYFSLLAGRVPDQLPLFLMLDATEIQNPYLVSQLLTQERYPRFHLAVKRHHLHEPSQLMGGKLAWEGSPLEKGMISRSLVESGSFKKSKLGFCLPGMFYCRPALTAELNRALVRLQDCKITFRVIPEADLAMEWENLDFLIIDPKTVETSFKRKLLGFCAAGGTVVSIGNSLGLPEERSLDDFIGSISAHVVDMFY